MRLRRCYSSVAAIKKRLEDAFWERVEKKGDAECWIWRGSIHRNGYGGFTLHLGSGRSKHILAHRLSYGLFRENFSRRFCVCHRCDNRRCVNPNHLFLGTQKDNLADMLIKGRHLKDGAHGNAKLVAAQVKDIWKMRGSGIEIKEIARHIGISSSQVCYILAGKSWRHISIPEGIRLKARKAGKGAHQGEKHGRSKLVEEDVREVFRMRDTGVSRKDIAIAIGISKSQVDKILLRQSWGHVRLENSSESTEAESIDV